MEKRRNVCLYILAAVVLAALVISIYQEKPILLSDKYPAITTGAYQATMEWDGQSTDESIEAKISNEEFRDILSSASVKKHKASNQMPSVAFSIHLTDGTKGYSVVVGIDHTISVAQTDSLQQSRTFWLDCEEDVFNSLYDCHLNSGGTAIGQVETQASQQKLLISVSAADDAYISEEIPQGQTSPSGIGFCCIGLKDVTIAIDGATMELENALREGMTSLGEITSLAQEDARSGFCTESWKSKNGLSHFCYTYPDFDLWITNDIYETPDGQQHLIRDVTLAQPDSNVTFVYNELDQEDWGIAFSVADASASEITLSYTQSGGQLFGQLFTCGYQISNLDRKEAVQELDASKLQEQMPIARNAQGSLTLDIETYFGPLPAGKYGMYLYLQDQYEEADIPPLARNYHDMQCYWIEFTIP